MLSLRILFFPLLLLCNTAFAAPLHVVAAENFYGNVAKQIGGEYVEVTSILNNPSQDPHLFNASPRIAKAITQANIIIYNGAAYDTWMERLITNSSKQATTIIVADLVGTKSGENPHIWYNPATMPRYAAALTTLLIKQDPTHASYYQKQLQQFTQSCKNLNALIKQLQQHYPNTTITATEPIFNDMAKTLGFKIANEAFQIRVMNGIEPSPTQTQQFENDLLQHRVKVLVYNDQVSNPLTQRMQMIAQKANIPILGVSETQPTDKTYVEWMEQQLKRLEQILSAHH